MKILNKMQRRVAIWILGAFKMSLSESIEAIAGIIPIRFHLQKIAKRLQMWSFKLPTNHILRNLIDNLPPSSTSQNPHSIGSLTNLQASATKGHLIDSCNKSYGIFLSFLLLNQEFFPGSHIIDIFPDCFSFNLITKKEKEKNDQIRVQELDNMVLLNSLLPHTALVITDASIKNDITTSILHVHVVNYLITKTVHHAAFVTSTEAELFAIRCGINQACSNKAINKIIVVTDSIHTAKKIFDSSSHPFQCHLALILSELQSFFISSPDNSIKFWKCLSCLRWKFHHNVDKDSKSFNPIPIFPCKISWDYCKKSDSDDIIKQWKMTFQASDGKGNHFMDLLDDDFNTIEPSYSKDGSWLQKFGHSNLLCACATRAITNYAPIGEYHLRFFPDKDFSYPCNNYPIKSRRHILHECKRFNGYWNQRRDSLSHFIIFLVANPNAFVFIDL